MNLRYYVPSDGKARLQRCTVAGWEDVPEEHEREPEVRVTRARFVTAVQESLAHITAGPGVDNFKSSYSYGQVDRVMQELARRLGLEPTVVQSGSGIDPESITGKLPHR